MSQDTVSDFSGLCVVFELGTEPRYTVQPRSVKQRMLFSAALRRCAKKQDITEDKAKLFVNVPYQVGYLARLRYVRHAKSI